ncbi:MAG: putative phosphohistidine phosphatase, SixA [Segetibacter sp.]|jgi:phosphohistidine phosphatase|nr:putative phosphohistidine phosphatase, SixA [Segetibacter sp.]
MKSLLIIRHAKSSWDFDFQDFDRPLNHRGENDAPAMAKRLLKKDIKIDAFVSSPAKRAFTTAALFAEVYDEKKKNIIIVPSLYEASVSDFFNAIEGFDKDCKNVALFSHNPGITAFANKLTDTKIDDMPTCAVFAVKADIKKWEDFATSKKEFWFFDYPKAHQ